ncbi:MAG: protein-export chaperone SecB [Gammaproteobacteria bacterium]
MAEQGNEGPQFSLERIYVKDVSYEAPAVPAVFTQQLSPQLNIQIGITHNALGAAPDVYEVVLAVTASAKHGDKTIFLVEIHQGGLFRIAGVAGDALAKTLEIACPYILLPFAREAVNDFVSKGGFPQLLLNPINFEALYEQKRAAMKQAAPAAQH